MFTDFLDLMARGGPVMWVIFITAWVALIMLIERALQLHLWIGCALRDQTAFDADVTFRPAPVNGKRSSPIAIVLSGIRREEVTDKEDLAKQMNIQLAELMPRLEGSLPTIAIIGSLLPMLGLLGTVTGMIEVFDVIALHGTGNPQEMAHGISQALLTTASGLIIAIPVIFAHHLLVGRLRFLLAVTEQSTMVVYNRESKE